MPAANFYGKKLGLPDDPPGNRTKTARKPKALPVRDGPPKIPKRKNTFKPGQSGNPAGRPKGAANVITQAHREFCREVMRSPEYRANLRSRIVAGIAGRMEEVVMQYAEGKVADKVDVTIAETRLEEWSKREPEKFTTLSEQVRAAHAFLEEVNKP